MDFHTNLRYWRTESSAELIHQNTSNVYDPNALANSGQPCSRESGWAHPAALGWSGPMQKNMLKPVLVT
jgi:hypothetical protein